MTDRSAVECLVRHTPASVAILRSLACASPPIDSARAQHRAWDKFKARCCRIEYSGIDEHQRNRYCVSDALTHVIIITAQCQNRPAYSALMKVVFRTRSAGQLGDPESETKGKIFLFNPLMIDNQIFDYFNPLQIVISRNFENVYV